MIFILIIVLIGNIYLLKDFYLNNKVTNTIIIADLILDIFDIIKIFKGGN